MRARLPDGVSFLGWGGLACAVYGSPSTLHYHELIAWALVWHHRAPAAFITHIFVDDPRSLRGGRELWGLPKERADFSWDARGVCMSVGGVPYVRLGFNAAGSGLPLPVVIRALGRADGHVSPFYAWGWMRAAPWSVRVEIGLESPLHGFGLERPQAGVAGPWTDLRVHAPCGAGGSSFSARSGNG